MAGKVRLRHALAAGVTVLAFPAAPAQASAHHPAPVNPPAQLSLAQGDLWGFLFTGGSPSTGYSWHFTVKQKVTVVKISHTTVASPNHAALGQPDLEVLAVAATHSGQATVIASLVPPGNRPATQTHTIHVLVDAH